MIKGYEEPVVNVQKPDEFFVLNEKDVRNVIAFYATHKTGRDVKDIIDAGHRMIHVQLGAPLPVAPTAPNPFIEQVQANQWYANQQVPMPVPIPVRDETAQLKRQLEDELVARKELAKRSNAIIAERDKLEKELKFKTVQHSDLARAHSSVCDQRTQLSNDLEIVKFSADELRKSVANKQERIEFLEKKMRLIEEAAKRINEVSDPFYNLD